MKRRGGIAAVMLLALAVQPALGGWANAEKATPTMVVEELHTALLEAMKASATVAYDARFAQLKPAMVATFDFPFMAEKCVGRAWKTLDAAQRTRWISTFEKFTIANYAGRFTGYEGQSFETLGEDAGAHETTLVRTQLLNPGADDVELTYRLRRVQGRWGIIDVYLNGTVSELALRRTEYSSVLKREGFDQLVVLLDQKIADLAVADAER